jgi:hypothetical protein
MHARNSRAQQGHCKGGSHGVQQVCFAASSPRKPIFTDQSVSQPVKKSLLHSTIDMFPCMMVQVRSDTCRVHRPGAPAPVGL